MDIKKLPFNAISIHVGSESNPTTRSHITPINRTSTFVIEKIEKAIESRYGESENKIYTYGRYVNPIANAVQHILLKMMKLAE